MSRITKEEYGNCLSMLIEEIPNHVLIKDLKKGYSVMNALYLGHALSEIKIPDEVATTTGDPDDAELRKLQRERSSLFGKRASWSNKFDICQSNKQRAEVSDQIQIIQNDIKLIMRQIEYYEQHGKPMPVIINEEYPVPASEGDRYKKRASLRAMISQIKKKLRQIADRPKNHPDWRKVDKLESQLSHNEKYLVYVDRAIKG